MRVVDLRIFDQSEDVPPKNGWISISVNEINQGQDI